MSTLCTLAYTCLHYVHKPTLPLEMASSTTMIVWVQIEGKSKKKVTISSNTDYDDLAGIATNGMSDPYIRDNVQVECEDVLMNPSDSITSRVLEKWGTPDKPFILRLRTKSLQEGKSSHPSIHPSISQYAVWHCITLCYCVTIS